MNKEKWLKIAEVIDALRVIPRGLLIGYGWFYLWYIDVVTAWYFDYLMYMVENQIFSVEAVAGSTAFVTSTITALGAMFTWFAGNVYMKTGRVWSKEVRREDIHQIASFLEKRNGTE